MRRLAALLLLWTAAASAQVIELPPRRTVATLGTCTDGYPRLAYVTDGASAGDCSTGSGSTEVLCRCEDGSWGAGAGAGTVTSVAATVPSIFSLSGSPITSSGTLGFSLASQSANYVFAGPTTGSSASPTFRLLAAADIPDLSAVYLPIAGNAATATALATDPAACSSGDFVSDVAADGTLTCGTPASGGASSSGDAGTPQLSDGSGGLTTDAGLDYDTSTDTLTVGQQTITGGSGLGITFSDGAGTEDVTLVNCEYTGLAATVNGQSLCLMRTPYSTDYLATLYTAGVAVENQASGAASLTAGAVGVTGGTGLSLGSQTIIAWASSTNPGVNAEDFWLYRSSANTLALKNRTAGVPAAFEVYLTAPDNSAGYDVTSDFERGVITGTAGSGVEIKAETAGLGADDLYVKLTPAGSGEVITNGPLNQVPGTTPTCNEGTSYYDSTDHDFCDCVGGTPAWRSRGGGGSCSS